MKKFCVYGLLLTAIMTPLSANAFDWSNLNIFKTKTTETKNIETKYTPVTPETAAARIQQLNNQIAAMDTITQNSFLSIVSALSPQQEVASFRSKMVSILAEPTINEYQRSNQMSELMSTYTTSLLDNKSYVTSAISGMSNSQKINLVNNLATLSKCSYNYAETANQYSNILSALSISSSNSSDLANAAIKNSVTNAKNKVKMLQNLVTQVSEVAKTSGLNFILPTN